jgi:hypothetical protein
LACIPTPRLGLRPSRWLRHRMSLSQSTRPKASPPFARALNTLQLSVAMFVTMLDWPTRTPTTSRGLGLLLGLVVLASAGAAQAAPPAPTEGRVASTSTSALEGGGRSPSARPPSTSWAPRAHAGRVGLSPAERRGTRRVGAARPPLRRGRAGVGRGAGDADAGEAAALLRLVDAAPWRSRPPAGCSRRRWCGCARPR